MYKVLLVDDEQTAKRSLRNIIGSHMPDFEVMAEAEDGREALDIVDQSFPDIIITDIRMPGMDGLQLAQEIRKRSDSAEIVIVTGYGQFEYAREALKFGVTDYLLKPIIPDEVVATLSAIMQRDSMKHRTIISDNERMKAYKEHLDPICQHLWLLNENEMMMEWRTLQGKLVDEYRYPVKIKEVYSAILAYISGEAARISSNRVQMDVLNSSGIAKSSDGEYIVGLLLDAMERIRADRNWGMMTNIASALKLIQTRFSDPDFSLSEAAQEAGMSTTYFSKCFKDETGVSFTEYLTNLRMNKAAQLLKNQGAKVYEVAQDVGYNEYSHFTKLFKKQFQLSPKDYRLYMNTSRASPIEEKEGL